jgi:hypothetical protein
MTFIDINAATIKTKHNEIYDLMRDIIKDKPNLSRKKLIAKWLDVVIDDPDMNNEAVDLAGRFVYNSVLERKPRSSKKAKTREARARRRVSRSMFGMMMPNGKTLGKCTFGEAAKFRAGFGRLARLGKPTQVIEDTITEAQARRAILG